MKTIPLKDMLEAIDRNDLGFYDRLNHEGQKEWSAWTAMRYASSANGTSAYHYILMVNSLVNADFNALRLHPGLQWKLLSLCGQGRSTFHPWIAPGKKKKKDRVKEFLLSMYPEASPKDLEWLNNISTPEEIEALALEAGLDKKEIKELLK